MAYLVLARKWRPQNFDDLIGQEHVSQTLTNAIRSGRIHHAFLFTGARGVGKTSAARILAKALNCEEGLSESPCNHCPSCKEITSGQGLDVVEIDGASNTGVDDVRELRENIRYLPSRSRFKIFIIDEVHMLSTSAFNALLKTLEEPPQHAKFIFATTEPHKIPLTILSRCQRFDFRKIPSNKVSERLRFIANEEQLQISQESLALVSRQSEGSMRDALSTLDQVIAFCGDQVDDNAVQSLLGMVDRRLLLDTLEAILQRDSRRVLELIRRVDQLGLSLRRYAQDIIELFRALVVCKVVSDPSDLLDVVGDELNELKALAGAVNLDDLQRSVTLLLKAQSDLAASPHPQLTLEMILVRLTTLAPTLELGKLISRLESLEKRIANETGRGTLNKARVQQGLDQQSSAALSGGDPPAKKPEAPVATFDKKGWQGLVEQVKEKRPMLGSVLEHGRPIKLEPPHIEIGYPEGSFMIGQIQEVETLEVLEGLASVYFDHPITLRIVTVDTEQSNSTPLSLAETRQAQETDRARRLKEDATNHPALKAVQEVFGGEIKQIIPIDKGFV
ncbi:MAG: DNA polymerase III subunit gamma/tau [Deltaproteobacteria bacterium]|jgi:DNA polymerase-3 subunit gamma/tau|nr:DNA polymerase III subunit gamma/tau [Deltaproteobacteria bacterium]